MSERLTPEREAEIRATVIYWTGSWGVEAIRDLGTEIDALRAENAELRRACEGLILAVDEGDLTIIDTTGTYAHAWVNSLRAALAPPTPPAADQATVKQPSSNDERQAAIDDAALKAHDDPIAKWNDQWTCPHCGKSGGVSYSPTVGTWYCWKCQYMGAGQPSEVRDALGE